MLSKVSKRVRRRSEQDYVASPIESRTTVVDRAPDLVRWCDFTTPFPTVTLGGYARYYTYAGVVPKVAEAPEYCPALSQDPNRSSPRDIPPKSSLFLPSNPPARSLGIIRESSAESMISRRPPALTVSTNMPHNSLRRQRRRILRTPSIERDFAVHARQFFASSASLNETSESADLASSSHYSDHSHSSGSHTGSAHSDSAHSESNHSSYTHSEAPLTPSTSVDSADHFEGTHFSQKLLACPEDTHQRPGSSSSFNTAKSGFTDA
ncbi:hypothetical protein BJ912DRAFT_1062609 [Pholiota molesta]|nr:hypothetical protein BJ912DRAFT_1062609 [Pholiota molesta]